MRSCKMAACCRHRKSAGADRCEVLYLTSINASCTCSRRLIEIEEAIETLDAAIEFKNETISSAREQLRRSAATAQVQLRSFTKLITECQVLP